jgi:hypothetical protein
MDDIAIKNSRKARDLFKKINTFYNKDDGIKFIKWLDEIKVYNITDNKIPGLLNTSKISVETLREDSTYNLILLWIIENIDKFKDYDLNGIPNSSFTDIEDYMKNNDQSKTGPKEISSKKTFNHEDDIKRWYDSPLTHPINGKYMDAMSDEYHIIWKKAFNILLKNKYTHKRILENYLPKNHLLFNGKFDFLYYNETKKNNTETEHYLNIFSLLTSRLEDTEIKDNKFDTEIELLKNLVSSMTFMKRFEDYCENMVSLIVDPDFNFDFNNDTIETLFSKFYPASIKSFITFMKTEKLSNGVIILDFLKNESSQVHPKWIEYYLKLFSKYDKFLNDINDLLKVNSTIVENRENKEFKLIEDPLDKYLKKYEDALEILKNDKYKRFINPQTLKPIDKKNYLDDKEYTAFEKEFKLKDTARKKNLSLYETKYKEYETLKKKNTTAKSPSPPKQRFTIQLPNGRTYINGQEKPFYIPDNVMSSFNKEYEKSKKNIEEYAKVKKMPYLELVKFIEKRSPSREIKDFAKDNILFSMSREEINNNILYDEFVEESQLADRCNDSNDILTRDDFDSEDFPLSKLQLLVRLKIYYKKDKYKTECIYAPALYNYLIECIQTKKPFINPLTRVQYTEEHINELMKVMRIINPNIERPYFLKPITDKKLTIDYHVVPGDYRTNNHNLEFYSIDLYRKFGDYKYKLYHICTIPSNIEPTGDFATNSNDLSSTTMLFRIFKLFEDGRLLHKYVPPYSITENGYTQYISMMIHFNRYKYAINWTWNGHSINSKKDIVDMFKLYAQEINNYIYG